MESEVEEKPNANQIQTLLPRKLGLGLGLGVGVGVGLGLISLTSPRKPLYVALTVFDGALTGTKALHRLHSPESLILASKTLAKGYKATKHLHPTPVSDLADALKPYLGTLNLLRYLRSPALDAGFGVLSYGYKFSKNLFKVLKGFAGFEVDAAVRNGLDSVGLVVKAVKVARELEQIREEERKRGFCGGFQRGKHRIYRYRCRFSEFDRRFRVTNAGECIVGFENGVSESEGLELNVLCLAVPVRWDEGVLLDGR